MRRITTRSSFSPGATGPRGVENRLFHIPFSKFGGNKIQCEGTDVFWGPIHHRALQILYVCHVYQVCHLQFTVITNHRALLYLMKEHR